MAVMVVCSGFNAASCCSWPEGGSRSTYVRLPDWPARPGRHTKEGEWIVQQELSWWLACICLDINPSSLRGRVLTRVGVTGYGRGVAGGRWAMRGVWQGRDCYRVWTEGSRGQLVVRGVWRGRGCYRVWTEGSRGRWAVRGVWRGRGCYRVWTEGSRGQLVVRGVWRGRGCYRVWTEGSRGRWAVRGVWRGRGCYRVWTEGSRGQLVVRGCWPTSSTAC